MATAALRTVNARRAQLRYQPNLRSFEQWLTMIAGGVLAGYGLKRRESPGGAAAIAGAALLYRGVTGHRAPHRRWGTDRGSPGIGVIADRGSNTREELGGARGIRIHQAVTINRPVSLIYRFWRDFENLPRFMRHLESVAVQEEGISHWVATGPAGLRADWHARIINDVQGEVIGWQSLDGSRIATAGSVHFSPTDRGTTVTVHLQYQPPGGKIGAAFARLFGEDPNQSIREDLRRLKQLLETGEVPTTKGQPSGRRGDSR